VEFFSNINFTLEEIKKSQSQRSPSAPFITSTLQQEASNKLSW
jgi:DNA topoisomerase IA